MKKGINLKILREDDGDGICEYQLEIRNETILATIDFWGSSEIFEDFANELIRFPKDIHHRITYRGEKNYIQYDYDLFMDVFCYEPNGHSAIHLKISNNDSRPTFREKSEFNIRTVPASINKLGKMLRSFNPALKDELVWEAE